MRNYVIVSIVSLLVGFAFAPPASAQATRPKPKPPRPAATTTEDEAPPRDVVVEMANGLVGVRAGASIGQVFSELGASVMGEIVGSWQFPTWHRRLGLMGSFGYSQPSATVPANLVDPRLGAGGALVDWSATRRDLALGLGLNLWWPIAGVPAIPFGAAGGKLHLTRTDVRGSANGAIFGENRESKTRLGWFVRGGTGMRLGRGVVTLDLSLEGAPVDEVTTGSANAGALIIAVGYVLAL
jgi:hypothetical protein